MIIRPITTLASMFRDPKKLPDQSENAIGVVNADQWPSPLQPVAPMGVPGTEPKAFQYYEGQNLQWTPRFDAEYSAADLKALATYPLVRICIENVKDVLCDMEWEIRLRPLPGESIKENKKRAQGDKTIVKLSRFFESPDGQHQWDEWLRPWLDDLLVIDAPTVLVRRTFGKNGSKTGGEVKELRVLRGDSISVYIDQNGWSPEPPSVAYAQNWWGLPLVDMTRDECLYRPRNIAPRNTIASQLYGYSPVEQLAPELKIGIARLAFVLAYYSDGSVPGVVQVAPKGTTPDQIKEAVQWINSDIAGNLVKRRQWNIIQGFQEDGKAEQIIMTKEPLLADLYDEKHIREIAFGIGTSPQRLMKSMNRASAEQSDDAAETEGTRPYVRSIRGLINHCIQNVFGFDEYEFVIDPVKEMDMEKQANALKVKVGACLLTPNEGREQLGLDKVNTPEADELGVLTGTGFVTIGQTALAANTAAETAKITAKGATENDNGKETPGKPVGANANAGAGKSAKYKPNGHDREADRGLRPREVNQVGFAAGVIAEQPPEGVIKFDEDEPRDAHGEWTSGDVNDELSREEKYNLREARKVFDDDRSATAISKDSEILVKDGKNAAGRPFAAALLRELERSPEKGGSLYRGLQEYDLKNFGNSLEVDKEFQLVGLKSFSKDAQRAEDYGVLDVNTNAKKPSNVALLKIEGPSKSVSITNDDRSLREHVTNGKFKVTKITVEENKSSEMADSGKATVTTYHVKQLGIFTIKK
jgi:hypothetical protein